MAGSSASFLNRCSQFMAFGAKFIDERKILTFLSDSIGSSSCGTDVDAEGCAAIDVGAEGCAAILCLGYCGYGEGSVSVSFCEIWKSLAKWMERAHNL